MIIFRYLAKEVIATVAATTIVLLLIFLSTQFVHYLSDAAFGRFSSSILFHIMLLQIPYLLGLLMPLGLYLAVLTAYGRLYVDREMMVFSSCGVSQTRILMMTMTMAVGVAVIVAILTLWLAPYVATAQKRLMAQAKSAPLIETLMPGRFYTLDNGRKVFYIEQVSSDHTELNNIFVAEQSTQNQTWSIVSAHSGYQTKDVKEKEHKIVVEDGNRYDGIPGDNAYQIQHFNQFSWFLPIVQPILAKEAEMLPTSTLWHMDNKNMEDKAELQWRLAMPISVLLLALLALPLSKVNPRQGKFAAIVPAVLIYVIYANMMFVSRDWIQSGALSPTIGLWWLHGVLLMTALIIMFFRSNLKTKVWRTLFARATS